MPRRNNPSHMNRRPLSVRNCDDKRRYASKDAAIATKEYQELLNMGLELRVYKCNVAGCGGWHLTRSGNNDKLFIDE